MSQTKIAWGDGTTDYFYLDYTLNRGNQVVTITADLNKEITVRTKRLSIKTSSDNRIKATLIITQTRDGIGLMIIEKTFVIPNLIKRFNNAYNSNTYVSENNDTSVFASIKQLIRKFI